MLKANSELASSTLILLCVYIACNLQQFPIVFNSALKLVIEHKWRSSKVEVIKKQ